MTTIQAQAGPQTKFLATPADIAIYGGAAGGGKTWALLIEPLRHIKNPNFGAVFFRRTFRQVMQEGGMWDEAEKLYPYLGGVPKRVSMEWIFPETSKIAFAYLATEKDKFNYDGAQIPLIAFDQLEHFTKSQFFYMLGRNRSTCGIRPYIRATCNPDAGSWLAEFLGWWINQDTGYAIDERGGIIRFFVRSGDEIVWGNSRQELTKRFPRARPLSVTFIPASIYDNKILLRSDPDYLAKLEAMSLLERERLLKGNWKVRPAAGILVNMDWFETVTAVPPGGRVIRFWDFAATKKKLAKDDPDFTAGVLMKFINGSYYVMDCIAFQESPMESERRFLNVTIRDANRFKNEKVRYAVRWELEGGAAARRDAVRLMKSLTSKIPGIDAKGIPARGDKIVRGKAFSSQAEGGNVYILEGRWNQEYLQHMHHQPDWPHDDIYDANNGAFNELTQSGWARGSAS